MALAVLFLLVGMLATEAVLFGFEVAGFAGAALLAIAAWLLAKNRDAIWR